MSDTPSRVTTRADLEAYIGHFNAKRYEPQIAYYAPDVIYKVGSLTLPGVDHFAPVDPRSAVWPVVRQAVLALLESPRATDSAAG